MFGIFVVLLIEARRLNVSACSASLGGIGTLLYLLITTALDAAPDLLAVAIASVGYAVFVLAAEMVRLRLTNAPSDRGGRPLVSPVRLFRVLIALAGLCMASAYWSQVGLPTPGEGRTPIETAVGTLLGSIVLALVFIVWHTIRNMRRRFKELVLGCTILSTTRRLDTAEEVAVDAGDDSPWLEQTVALVPGSTLVSVSDGVHDLFDGTLASLAAVDRLVREAPTAQDLIDSLMLQAGLSAPDDVTVLIIRRASER
jgi:hypothetical protein